MCSSRQHTCIARKPKEECVHNNDKQANSVSRITLRQRLDATTRFSFSHFLDESSLRNLRLPFTATITIWWLCFPTYQLYGSTIITCIFAKRLIVFQRRTFGLFGTKCLHLEIKWECFHRS